VFPQAKVPAGKGYLVGIEAAGFSIVFKESGTYKGAGAYGNAEFFVIFPDKGFPIGLALLRLPPGKFPLAP
jgi:hypothetical protein